MATNKIDLFNTPGSYTWSKYKDANGVDLPAAIIIEVCGGAGGGSSGFLLANLDLTPFQVIGGGGGGAAGVIMKTYDTSELDNTINIVVGDGGLGGIAPSYTGEILDPNAILPPGWFNILPGVDGVNGQNSTVGPVLNGQEILTATKGYGGLYVGQYPDHMSSGGKDGGKSSVYSSQIDNNGESINSFTYGGGAGSGFYQDPKTGVVSVVPSGTSIGGGQGGDLIPLNGGFTGADGLNATQLGCGGGGGSGAIIHNSDSGKAGNGGNGAPGYVKITTIFTV